MQKKKKIAIEMQPAIKLKKFGLAIALDFDLKYNTDVFLCRLITRLHYYHY